MKLLKLKMIWNILKGRTVVYKAKFLDGTLIVDENKSCIVNNVFDKTVIKNGQTC